MINPQDFYEKLQKAGISFFTGVPDSLLKDFCAYVDDHGHKGEHIITANEGNAVAMVAGYHLTTGKLGVVYMQNSGLGNAVNPLISIADAKVYKIPLLMIIGWRGEPGVKDEPQHVKQGAVTRQQLNLLDIPYWVLDADTDLHNTLEDALDKIKSSGSAVALLVRKGTFSKYESKRQLISPYKMQRETALRILLDLTSNSLVVTTTGKTSREVFELRVERNESHSDFLMVGGMGHTASIGLGAALGNSEKQVVCIDGDGSILMHLGALTIIGNVAPKNLVHILLNNEAHESVGKQPTVAGNIDFKSIALASGYQGYQLADDPESIYTSWQAIQNQTKPVLFEIKITTGSRDDLGRPTSTPEENKLAFMKAAGL